MKDIERAIARHREAAIEAYDAFTSWMMTRPGSVEADRMEAIVDKTGLELDESEQAIVALVETRNV